MDSGMIWILNRATLHKLHRGIKPGYRGSIFKGEVKLERTIITGCETPWNIVTFNVAQGGIPFYPLQTLVKRVTVSCTNGSNILLIRTMNGECKSFTRALMRLLLRLNLCSCSKGKNFNNSDRITSLYEVCARLVYHCSARQSGTVDKFFI